MSWLRARKSQCLRANHLVFKPLFGIAIEGMKTHWTGEFELMKEMLARWRGARAEPIAYTVSHGIFILGLFPSPRTSNRVGYIECKDCQVIQLYQTHWENADIGISVTSHRLGRVHTITDPGRLHLVCYAAFVTEVETPINFHKEWNLFPEPEKIIFESCASNNPKYPADIEAGITFVPTDQGGRKSWLTRVIGHNFTTMTTTTMQCTNTRTSKA